MANRTLAYYDEGGDAKERGEHPGHFCVLRIERSSAGAPGLYFVIEEHDGGQQWGELCVYIEDGAAFLAPVNGWLAGNDPEAWVVHSIDMGDMRFATKSDCWGGYRANFEPRPGYNQNREDYS